MKNEEDFPVLIPREESELDKLEKKMIEKGYSYLGQKFLTEYKMDEKTARFMAIVVHSKDEIKKEYINKYADQGEIEIELIDIEGLSENQQAVHVFIRVKK